MTESCWYCVAFEVLLLVSGDFLHPSQLYNDEAIYMQINSDFENVFFYKSDKLTFCPSFLPVRRSKRGIYITVTIFILMLTQMTHKSTGFVTLRC